MWQANGEINRNKVQLAIFYMYIYKQKSNLWSFIDFSLPLLQQRFWALSALWLPFLWGENWTQWPTAPQVGGMEEMGPHTVKIVWARWPWLNVLLGNSESFPWVGDYILESPERMGVTSKTGIQVHFTCGPNLNHIICPSLLDIFNLPSQILSLREKLLNEGTVSSILEGKIMVYLSQQFSPKGKYINWTMTISLWYWDSL